MEGSDTKTVPMGTRRAHAAKTTVVLVVLRLALGLVFLVMGAGLLLEGLVAGGAQYLYLEGVNRAFESYVGIMSLALAGLLFGRISTRPRED